MTPKRAVDPCRLFLASAAAVTLWLIGLFLWHFTYGSGRRIEHVLFLDQDFAALLIALLGLTLLSPLARGEGFRLPAPSARVILPLVALSALWSWAGHYLVFQDYVLSRDEESAEFAAAYLRDGLLGRPIPAEWIAYRRAIMPEFFSPFGAASHWTSAYLPVNSAIRALFAHLGDPNLAGPVLLAIGLVALWRVALRLFPDRPDAVWVAMLTALASAQLSVTAMTPYAMTGHFALNMVWLALFLRGGWVGHGGAALTAIVAAGLHQYHFPPIFIAPFLLFLLLGRRWGPFLLHLASIGIMVGLWAKAWPLFLLHHLGPVADVRPSAGVGDKFDSLLRRLTDKWEPLFNLTRLLAWNPVLMMPLAVVGAVLMPWRDAIRGRSIILPLALGCVATCLLALHQGYGWGFRYAHGFIGSFCLLAAYGWVRLGDRSLRPIVLATGVSLVAAIFLTARAHHYVAPYAAGERAIRGSGADIVLVDPRGGVFANDLVRTDHGDLRPPVVMSLPMLTPAMLDRLCGRYDVALFDRNDFRRFGIPLARWYDDRWVSALRRHLDARGCGRPVTAAR